MQRRRELVCDDEQATLKALFGKRLWQLGKGVRPGQQRHVAAARFEAARCQDHRPAGTAECGAGGLGWCARCQASQRRLSSPTIS